ncbi:MULTISPECIES: hypothetical protein [unclassified Serratia (in: enterobacteria)]|uniref:hypothetical protein n=1 Tax=unclassified Serratia (in: enterobacteria) TaxID=2647522 RepID=UPI0021ADFE41|nr:MULTISPECIES: hypothetical protein [unclassified Serratia (in: enterobacteria)]
MDNKSELSKPTACRNKHTGRTFNATENTEPQIYESLYSQEYVSALLEKSKEKDERAIACVNAFDGIETERIAGKSLGEFLAGELYLNKAEPKQDGSFGFTFSGLAVQLMADCFADQFKSSGAINYLELLFEHAEVGEMTVTMQRVEGLTPAQKLAAAEQRIAELEAIRAAAEKLVRCKGRYHSEQNYRALAALFGVTTPDLPPVDGDSEAVIAELRAKLATPVRLPGALIPAVHASGEPFMRPEPFGFYLNRDDVIKKLRAAGFTVQGDE